MLSTPGRARRQAPAPDRARRPRLILFVKEPVPGRVKTRLARGIGPVGAAWWLRHQTARLVRRLGADPRWQTLLAVAPDRAVTSRALPSGPVRMAQGTGDLGTRMLRAMRAAPPGPVVLVGADIPGLTRGHIAGAFAKLGPDEAALGPACDGGYWLIGLKRGARPLPRDALANVRWSGPHALADSAASLAPLRVAEAGRLADVDEPSDLPARGEPGF